MADDSPRWRAGTRPEVDAIEMNIFPPDASRAAATAPHENHTPEIGYEATDKPLWAVVAQCRDSVPAAERPARMR
jgi:hypothetical protein